MTHPNEVINAYLDGTISEEQFQQLLVWINADPANAHLFSEYALLDHHIYEELCWIQTQSQNDLQPVDESNELRNQIMREMVDQQLEKQKQINEDSDRLRAIALTKCENKTKARSKPPMQRRHEEQERSSGVMLSFAGVNVYRSQRTYSLRGRLVAVAVIALAVVLGWQWMNPPKQTPRVAVAPQVAAQITRQRDARWEEPIKQYDYLAVGSPLKLIDGYAEVTFGRGSTVILQAPCELELQSNNSLLLHQGKLVAEVPYAAHGFTVHLASGVKIVDLGTKFGVALTQDGSADAVVFKGEVELAEKASESETASKSVRITEGLTGRAFSYGKILEVTPPATNEMTSQFARSWDQLKYMPKIAGQVRYLHSMPKSLEMNRYEKNNEIALMREKTNVPIDRNLNVTFTQPGLYKDFEKIQTTIPAGVRMDCYFLHFDPKQQSKEESVNYTYQGEINFDRPILGVIANAKHLNGSDPIFGQAGTAYPAGDKTRGCEPAFTEDRLVKNESILLSEDHRTLKIDGKATSGGFDQIRILVEAAGQPELVNQNQDIKSQRGGLK